MKGSILIVFILIGIKGYGQPNNPQPVSKAQREKISLNRIKTYSIKEYYLIDKRIEKSPSKEKNTYNESGYLIKEEMEDQLKDSYFHITTEYFYNEYNQLIRKGITSLNKDGTLDYFDKIHYEYNNKGNLISECLEGEERDGEALEICDRYEYSNDSLVKKIAGDNTYLVSYSNDTIIVTGESSGIVHLRMVGERTITANKDGSTEIFYFYNDQGEFARSVGVKNGRVVTKVEVLFKKGKVFRVIYQDFEDNITRIEQYSYTSYPKNRS